MKAPRKRFVFLLHKRHPDFNLTTRQKIVEYINSCFRSEAGSALTFGVEQEFFLYAGSNAASHDASQDLFKAVASALNGTLERADDSGIGNHISGCKFSIVDCPVTLKYEHHPHLLEFEFAPMSSIADFEPVLRSSMQSVLQVANELKLDIEFRPFLRRDVPDEQVESQHSLCRSLRNYRRALNADRPEVLNQPSLINFSAYIASTHFHIGGIPKTAVAYLLNKMYQLEPQVMQFAWSQVADVDRNPKRRFDGFYKTAQGLPLVGFPDLENWNLESWSDALLKMPHADLGEAQAEPGNIQQLFKCKRDLSIIQPREYGTFEFRGDPCLPTSDAILGVLAFRLGLMQNALPNLGGDCDLASFRESRTRWLDFDSRGDLDVRIVKLAADGLERNRPADVKYLQAFGSQV